MNYLEMRIDSTIDRREALVDALEDWGIEFYQEESVELLEESPATPFASPSISPMPRRKTKR